MSRHETGHLHLFLMSPDWIGEMENPPGRRPIALVRFGRRLDELNGGMAARGDLLHVRGLVADMQQAQAAEKGVAFFHDQYVVPAGEKCGPLPGLRIGGIAKKFGRHLQRGRRGRQPGADKRNLFGGLRCLRRRRSMRPSR